MAWKLFIDDERTPVKDGWVIARSSGEAIDLVLSKGIPDEIAFDHDLGGVDTSIVFINWLIDSFLDNVIEIKEPINYSVHSQNPIGVQNIKSKLDAFNRHLTTL